MHYIKKQKLYKTFLTEWGDQFNKLPELERFFQAYYPEVIEEMDYMEFIKSQELEASQLEWVSLLKRLQHSTEKEFFKPWWVPLSRNKYEYFLDLSAHPFRVFKVNFEEKQGRWYSEDVLTDISEFILGLEDGSIRLNIPTEDEDGNPIDENGNRIISETKIEPEFRLEDEFTGYDLVSIDYQATKIRGHFLESPLEERLIERFNYTPVADNSRKPFQAFWDIEQKKLLLHLVNATINGNQFYTRDIAPETDELPEEEFLYHFTSFSGTLTFVVDKIDEPGIFSYKLEKGDKVFITVKDGLITLFTKNKI